MENSPKWHEKDVPFSVFTWAMGVIVILFGFVFAQITTLNSSLTQIKEAQVRNAENLSSGQDAIREQLIRIDERQQTNIANINKVLSKLNIQ